MIINLVNMTWFSHYPHCHYLINDNGSKFKLHIKAGCVSFRIKRKPTSVKNPQANAILEQVHQVITTMLHTPELDIANTVEPSDIDAFLTDTAWAIHSTHHIPLNPPQMELSAVRRYCSTYPSLLQERQLSILSMKVANWGHQMLSDVFIKFLMVITSLSKR